MSGEVIGTGDKRVGEDRRLRKNPPDILYFLYKEDETVFSKMQEEPKKNSLIRISLMDREKVLTVLAKAGNRINVSSNLDVLFVFHQFYS